MKKNSKRTNLVQIHGNPPLPINAIQWTPEQINEMRINTPDGSRESRSKADPPTEFSSVEKY